MTKTFGIWNFDHCYLFGICNLGFVIWDLHYPITQAQEKIIAVHTDPIRTTRVS